jgi:uncharacterized membrane protein YraQ (UPF0718 family)
MDINMLLQDTFAKVIGTFAHNWYLLLLSIVISAALKFYVDQDAIARFLRRNTKNSVLVSTGIAVGTPFCSCGTTAVVLGMMASTVPWAPIVAFLVASPLTSPQELFYSAGIFGWPFAIAFFVASILLGLLGGLLPASRSHAAGWQTRLAWQGQNPLFPWASWARLPPWVCLLSRSLLLKRRHAGAQRIGWNCQSSPNPPLKQRSVAAPRIVQTHRSVHNLFSRTGPL